MDADTRPLELKPQEAHVLLRVLRGVRVKTEEHVETEHDQEILDTLDVLIMKVELLMLG